MKIPNAQWNWVVKETKVKVKVIQLCLTLRNPMDYSAHGILQARILEWGAFHFSKGSSQHKNWTHVSHVAGGFFTSWVIREALKKPNLVQLNSNS